MLPLSQLILLVILIIVALVLLNWEANHSTAPSDELSEEEIQLEPQLSNQDHNQLSS